MPEKKSDKKPLYVELHALRSYPPSNLNRDDLGAPKSIVFGDVRRVRVSSQCLKRTWRMSPFFRDELKAVDLGTRTARLAALVGAQLSDDSQFPAEASEGLDHVFAALGKKSGTAGKAKESLDEDDGDGDGGGGGGGGDDAGEAAKTPHLLFLSHGEINAVVKFALAHVKALVELARKVRDEAEQEKKEKDAKRGAARAREAAPAAAGAARKAKHGKKESAGRIDDLRDKLKRFLAETAGRTAVDVALFGRFLTSDEFGECNAALQVAHALGTQKLELGYDYFAAVDDLQPSAGTGAEYLGETELCASVLYEYAVCDVPLLRDNLGGDTALAARAIKAIAQAMCRSIFEKAKRNGTAPHTPADFLEVVIRRDAPMSLANAFLKPVRPEREKDVMDVSIERLLEQQKKYDQAYGSDGVERFVLDLRRPKEGTHRTLVDLATAAENKIIEAAQ